MTYHKWTPLPKAMGPLMGAGMTGTGKNRQFGYPYLHPHGLPKPVLLPSYNVFCLRYLTMLSLP